MTNQADESIGPEPQASAVRTWGRPDHELAFLLAEALGLQPVNHIRLLEFRFHAEEISTVRVEHEIHQVGKDGIPEMVRTAQRLELRPIERVGYVANPSSEPTPE